MAAKARASVSRRNYAPFRLARLATNMINSAVERIEQLLAWRFHIWLPPD